MVQCVRAIAACSLFCFLLIAPGQQPIELPEGVSAAQFAWLQELARAQDRSQVVRLVSERREWRGLESFEQTCKAFDTNRPAIASAWLPAAKGLIVLSEHIRYADPSRAVFPSDRHYAQAYASFKLAGIAASARDLNEAEARYKDAIALFSGNAAGTLGPSPGSVDQQNNELFGTSAKQLAGMGELNLGTVYRDAGDLESAQRSFEASLATLEGSDDARHIAMAHLDLGDVLINLGSMDRALVELNTAKAEYETLKDEPGIAQCQLNLGNLYVRTSEFQRAITAYREAKRVFESTGDFMNLVTVLQNEGVAYLNQGKLPDACASFERARDLSASQKDLFGLARATMNLGAAKFTMQRPLEAIVCFEAARQTAKDSGDEFTAASALSNLGTCYQELGLNADAILCLEEALTILRAIKAPNEIAVTQSSIGMTLTREGRRDAAIAVHGQALLMFEELKAQREVGVCHLNLAQLYFENGDLAKAQEHVRSARSVLAGTEAAPDLARLSLLSGQLAGAAGHTKPANRQMRSAMDEFRSLGLPLDYVKASTCLGDLYSRAGDRRGSSEAYAQGLQALQELQVTQSDPLSSVLSEMGSSLLAKYLGSVRDRISGEEAFSICQRTKGGLLRATLLDSTSVDVALSDQDAKRFQDLRRDYERVDKDLRKDPGNERLQASRKKALAALNAFDVYLRAKSPKFRALQSSPATLKEVCAALGPRTALVEYILGDQDVFALVVRQRGGKPTAKTFPLKVPALAVKRLVREFNIQLKRQPSNLPAIRQLGKSLNDHLFKPLDGSLAGVDRLIICPDRMLHDLPFGALVQGNGKYLIESYSISTAASASSWHACRVVGNGRRQRASGAPLVVGISQFGERSTPPARTLPQAVRSGKKLDALPAAGEEAQFVARILGCDPILESKATVPSVTKRISFAELLHFATHAAANGAAPLMGYLVLAPHGKDDLGLLYARDVYRMRTQARLAVLSACETLGSRPTGEGILGLSWAFLVAGCPSTVSTRWDLEDVSARIWIGAFYTDYVRGNSVADSAQKACLSLIRTKGRRVDRSSPSYWAAWTVVGDDR